MRELTKKEKRILAINKLMVPLMLFMIDHFKIYPEKIFICIGEDEGGWKHHKAIGYNWFKWRKINAH